VANFGEDFGEEEAAVGIAKGIVFEAAVGGFVVGFLIGFAAWVDEDTDDRGHVTFVDEVVKNDRDAEAAVGVGVAGAVLPDHEAAGLIGLMIGGGINSDPADGIGEDLAVFPFEGLEGAFGDVGVGEAFGGGFEMFDANLAALLNASVDEDAIIGFGEVGKVKGEDLQAIGADLNHIAEQFAIFANDAGRLFGEGGPSDGGAFDLGGGAIVDEGLMAEEADDFAMEDLLGRGIHGRCQGSEEGLWGGRARARVLGGFGRLSEEVSAEEEEGANQVQTGEVERPEGERACHDTGGERDERKGLSKTLWRSLSHFELGYSRSGAKQV
jgi:hypothetical protein